jgi:hypothetical protein
VAIAVSLNSVVKLHSDLVPRKPQALRELHPVSHGRGPVKSLIAGKLTRLAQDRGRSKSATRCTL